MENYIAKKSAGLVEITKVNDSYAIGVKKFNGETGLPYTEVQGLDKNELLNQKQSLTDEIANIDAMLSDIEKLG